MTTSRYGFNFICDAPGFNDSAARAVIERLRPRWIIVINGLAFAKDIAARYPETDVIVRWVRADDDARKSWPTPGDFIEFAKREFGGARLYANLMNENGVSDDVLRYTLAVIEQSSDLRLAVGGFSVGTPEPEDWKRPLAVELLKKLDTQRDRLVLNLHEYFPAVPHAGMGEAAYTNPQPAAWPLDIRHTTCWLIGRYQFLVQTCQEHQIGTPRIVIGEHGPDRIDQFKGYLGGLLQTPPYSEIRGWRTLSNQYRAWYNTTPENALFTILKYTSERVYYHPAVEGISLFAWCSPQSEWEGFDMSQADDLQTALVSYANESTNPPARRYEPGTYLYSGENSFNIRTTPSKQAAVKGQLTTGATVQVADVDAVDASDHLWQRVTVFPAAANNVQIEGWVAVDIILPKLKEEEPPAPPEPPVKPVFTRADLLALATYHEAAAKAHADLAALYKQLAERV